MASVKSISGAVATNVVATAVAGTTFYGFSVNAAGAGAVVITFFDNATTSTGTILYSASFTAAANDDTRLFNIPQPLRAANGITASIATTAVGDISVWVS
jgi:hypothetical protein